MNEKINIIQYWDGELPADLLPLVSSWNDKNPCCQHLIFDRKAAMKFFSENFSRSIVEQILRIQIPAMFSDVFRVAIVKILGGLYVDCGTKCLASISNIISIDNKATFIRKNNGWIWNGFIAAPKHNKEINKLWDKIESNLLSGIDGNIWALTGPKVFMDVLSDGLSTDEVRDLNSETLESIANIKLLHQKEITDTFDIVNKLSHKGASHWSKIQNLLTLYEPKKIILENTFKKMNKKIIIHIGQHATGAEAIQKSLALETKSNKSNFLYPNTGRKGNGHHIISDIFSILDIKKINVLFDDFYKECFFSPHDKVVISSEFLSSKNDIDFGKERMNNIWSVLYILANFFEESSIVFYTTEQDKAIESRIKQAIKSRICLSKINMMDFIKNPSLEYESFKKALEHYFCNSQVIQKKFESHESDLIVDFYKEFKLSGVPSIYKHDFFESIEFFEKMLVINKMNISTNEKMKLKNSLEVQTDNQLTSLLSAKQKLMIKDKFF